MPPKKRATSAAKQSNPVKTGVDKDWFVARLAEMDRSMRDMARQIDISPDKISRTLSGERKMQMEEANKIAQFLGTHVTEVLRHAGVQLDGADKPSRIMLAATINEDGRVVRIKEPAALPSHVIDRANAAITITGKSNIIAAQIRALTGPLSVFDDALLLFGHTDTVEGDAIGSLSICRNRDGEQILAKIDRARKTGEALLLCTDGKHKEFALHTAAPVIAIIP